MARRSSPSTTRPAAAACASTRASTAAGACPPHYDSLIAKVIVHAPTRAEAIAPHAPRARRVHRRRHPHQHPAPQAAPRDPEVIAGTMTTRTIERIIARGLELVGRFGQRSRSCASIADGLLEESSASLL